MSTKLKATLVDILTAVDPFKDVVLHVSLKQTGGLLTATAKAKDGTLFVAAKSRGEVPGYQDIACLGSLPYLRSALASGYMDNGSLDLNYHTASDGSSTVLRSIKLAGSKGYSVFYQAIDPFITTLNKIKLPQGIEWPVAFAIDQDFISNFDGVHRIHQQAPKLNTDRDDIFTLAYADDTISALFGEKGHQASVVLTDTAEAEKGVDKVSALYSISLMRSLLKLIGKGTAIGYLSTKALRVDIDTDHMEYRFTTYAKKVRE